MTKPSITLRIAIGKLIGFVIGIFAIAALPYVYPQATLTFQIGIFLWYVTVGAIIGVFGVYSSHPILHIPFPWWVRAPFIGAWMNLQVILLAYEHFQTLMTSALGPDAAIQSPYRGVLEGGIVGLIIGYFATRFGGEGKHLTDELSENAG